MKTAVLLFIILVLLSAMARSWEYERDYDLPDPCTSDSWDLKPHNPYEATVIIVDPYRDQ